MGAFEDGVAFPRITDEFDWNVETLQRPIPYHALRGMHAGGANVLMVDGSVRFDRGGRRVNVDPDETASSS